MIGKLLCKLFGHDERRLTKKESDKLAQSVDPGTVKRQRVCRRCDAARTTRPRTTKVVAQ